MAVVDARDCAASDSEGTTQLFETAEYATNQGTSSLEPIEGQATRRLDADLSGLGPVAVMKVDVERHEAAVFRGARSLLETGQIRDVVFEEHHSVPSAAAELLESAGYTFFKIGRTFNGPVLSAPEASHVLPVWLPRTFSRPSSQAARVISAPEAAGTRCAGGERRCAGRFSNGS